MNDLLFTQGKDNLAGIVDKIFIAATDDIDTIPDLASADSLVTAASDIVMKSTKKFQQIYITDETGSVTINSVGERDGKGRQTVLQGRYPALGKELADAIRLFQNTPSVLIYRLARNGKLYMIGVSQLDQSAVDLSLAIPAYFTNAEAGSGALRSDQNGALLSWTWTAAHDPIEYAGAVPLTPAA